VQGREEGLGDVGRAEGKREGANGAGELREGGAEGVWAGGTGDVDVVGPGGASAEEGGCEVVRAAVGIEEGEDAGREGFQRVRVGARATV
jgi:hypothetical protein